MTRNPVPYHVMGFLVLCTTAKAAPPPAPVNRGDERSVAALQDDAKRLYSLADAPKGEPLPVLLERMQQEIRKVAIVGSGQDEKLRQHFDQQFKTLEEKIATVAGSATSVSEAVDKLRPEIAAIVAGAVKQDVDVTVSNQMKTLLPWIQSELASRARAEVAAVETNVKDLSARIEKGEVDARAQREEIAKLAYRLDDLFHLTPAPRSAFNADAYRARTKLVIRRARGDRSNGRGSGDAVLYWYPGGKETPLSGQVISIYSSVEENGPKTKVGDFSTDENGHALFEFPILKGKFFLHYEFTGDSAFKGSKFGPKSPGITT